MNGRILIVTALVSMAAALSACGDYSTDEFGSYKKTVRHEVVDGVSVTCLMYRNDKGTGTMHCWRSEELRGR